MRHRHRLPLLAGLAAMLSAGLGSPLTALAQEAWPARPISYVVPYPPGGTTDILGRTLAQRLGEALKVPVVVENKAGATGTIGGAFVARAAPDGLTLLGTSIGPQAIVPHLMKLPYDPAKAYEPVALIGTVPHLLVVHPAAPFASVAQLTAAAKDKPGANAVLATEAVAAAKADGLTLLGAATNHTMIPALYGARIKFDAAKSFAPVCTLASSATVLVVGPSLPVTSVAAFIERAKAKPDGVSYATPGQGSSPHLATEQFRKLTGVSLLHVPYKGAAPAVSDLMGGQVDASFATLGSVLPHLKSGKLRALAVASRQRSALAPDVPTFEEAGVKGFIVDTWYGLLAPAGTPAEALQALTRQATEFARSPAVRERLATAGLEPASVCGEAFAAQIGREIEVNRKVAQALNLKVE